MRHRDPTKLLINPSSESELNHAFVDDVKHQCESKTQSFQEISLLHMWSINHIIT
jgi:hypothetical protein